MKTIEEYLRRLREEMRGDDPALVQDALYDAEEYLRAELAEHGDRPTEAVIAEIVASYGAPAEVADAYRQTERTVNEALRAPVRAEPRSLLGRIFGVFVDPQAYTAILYMLLALASGIAYFTVAVAGTSVSIGLILTIVGIPFLLLFLAMVRILSLVEGRIVETMLGVRMPRRPVFPSTERGLWARIKNMFTDGRTWTTLLYMVLQLPLGVAYFCIVTIGFTVSLACLLAPVLLLMGIDMAFGPSYPVLPAHGFMLTVLGFVGLVAMMHLCRLVGRLHGHIAKHLLVRY